MQLSNFLNSTIDEHIVWTYINQETRTIGVNLAENAKQLDIDIKLITDDLFVYNLFKDMYEIFLWEPVFLHEPEFFTICITGDILFHDIVSIHINAESIINKPFINDFLRILKYTDCVVQTIQHKDWLGDGPNCGLRIFGVTPNEKTKKYVRELYLYKNDYLDYFDEIKFFNKMIRDENLLAVFYLPDVFYPNGNKFFRFDEFQKERFKIFTVTNMYGYKNWDTTQKYLGVPGKIETLKKLGYWYL